MRSSPSPRERLIQLASRIEVHTKSLIEMAADARVPYVDIADYGDTDREGICSLCKQIGTVLVEIDDLSR